MPRVDRPTEKDGFGFGPYVDGVEELIRKSILGDLPLTIGIYGPWGSGKTSFMCQLRSRFESVPTDHQFPVVWFDAWKYDRMDDVRLALMYKVLLDVRARGSGETRRKITLAMKTAAKLAVGLVARSQVTVGIPLIGGANATLPTLNDLADEVKEGMETLQTAVDKVEADFNGAIAAFLEEYARVDGHAEKSREKLIVFIDDLDRCLPDNVLVILEALKLFLHSSPCVFVLGVDRVVVERAIDARYGSSLQSHGGAYLDKIVQYPFNLPSVDQGRLGAHFAKALGKYGGDGDWKLVLLTAAEGNPRIYLRLLNMWDVTWPRAERFGFNVDDPGHLVTLAVATAIQVRFPGLYEVCRRNGDGFGTFVQMCQNPGNAHGGSAFDGGSAREFKRFWGDDGASRFIQNLRLRLRLTQPQICGPGNLIVKAFRLSGCAE